MSDYVFRVQYLFLRNTGNFGSTRIERSARGGL